MQVNITKRIDAPDGRRFCPVIIGSNGRVKPDWIKVDGREERHPEGAYYLDWYEDGKRRRLCAGTDATAAYNARNRKRAELDAIAGGLVVTDPIEEEPRLCLREAAADFIEDIELSRQRKTWLGYCLSLKYFRQSCSRTFVDYIERKDLLRFAAFLRDEKELSPRTVHNKFAEVLTFLQSQGVTRDVDTDHATCMGGERACPPEDCGGAPGYEDVLKVIQNPRGKRYAELRKWIGQRSIHWHSPSMR